MKPLERLVPARSAVVVVDVQERLAKAMPDAALGDLLRAVRIVVGAARRLGARVVYTEQYPKGLGATLAEVNLELEAAAARRFEKLSFSAWEAAGFAEALGGSDTIVLLGMETHVCVFQTARDLARQGFEVHVVVDGVCSRRADHKEMGLSLCTAAGAVRTTAETIAFDWLRVAGSNEFKEISALLR